MEDVLSLCFPCPDKANTSVTSAFPVNYQVKTQQAATLGL